MPLSCWRVDGAQGPARDQLKTFSLEALTPRVPSLGARPAMAFRRTEGMSMIQALAMTVAEIPVFLYTTFGQVRWVWPVGGPQHLGELSPFMAILCVLVNFSLL